MDPAGGVGSSHSHGGGHPSSSSEPETLSKWLGKQISWLPPWLTSGPLDVLQNMEAGYNSHVAPHVVPHLSWISSTISNLVGIQVPPVRRESPAPTILNEVGVTFANSDEHSRINQLILDYVQERDVHSEVQELIEYPLKHVGFIENMPLQRFEQDVRALMKNGNKPYSQFAETYTTFLSFQSQLYVLEEISDFMNLEGSLESIDTGKNLLTEVVTTVVEDAGSTVEILDLLQTKGWIARAQDFIALLEKNIQTMVNTDSEEFQKFCKERTHLFDLPYHGYEVHRELKRTGFVYSPLMVSPDRMICRHCNVQVSGFRAWYDPASLHKAKVEHPDPNELEAQPDVMYSGPADKTYEDG